MIKAVVFDLDDTLISEKDYIKSGFKVVARYISKNTSLEVDEVFNKLLNEFNNSSENVFNRVLDSFEIKYTVKEIKGLVNLYRNHTPDIDYYDGVYETLKRLKKEGYKLGIITDGYKETQRAKLKVLGSIELFDYIVVTDELGREYWKPHEKAYKLITEKLKVGLSEVVYIGDNEEKDFVTANKFGMTTICIKRKESIYANKVEIDEKKKGKYYIKDIKEIFNYL